MNQIASGGRLRNRFESLPAVAIAIIALALLIACVGLAQNLILSRLPAISAIVRFSQRYTIHPYSIGLLFALAAGIMLVGLAQPRLLRYHSMIATMLFVLAILIVVVGAIERNFFLEYNLQNNGKRLALLAIYAIGGSLAIIAAGIDLSVGSLIGLIAVFLPLLITAHGIPIGLALAMVLLLAVALGLAHGVLIAKFNLQPFIVTLCGLLAYRSVARTVTGDMTQGFGGEYEGFRQVAIGAFLHVPIALYLMLAIAIAVGTFLHLAVWGRHLYALGQNEEAARYSGINVDRLKILAYTLSGLLAGVAGVLLALDTNSVQPSDAGKTYELYGIAAAVLGGCSLRGGEGTVVGVVVGATVLTVLRNLIILVGLSTYVEDILIGMVILGMVTVDEILKRRAGGVVKA